MYSQTTSPLRKNYCTLTACCYNPALSKAGYPANTLFAGVVELVDTSDSKSDALKACRFESGHRYHIPINSSHGFPARAGRYVGPSTPATGTTINKPISSRFTELHKNPHAVRDSRAGVWLWCRLRLGHFLPGPSVEFSSFGAFAVSHRWLEFRRWYQ